MRIFIRAETYPNEFRAPLVPHDVRTLLEEGHSVIVQSSETRCFTDEEYMEDGAIISYKPWYQQDPQTLIVGLKELDHLEMLNGHTHVYFSHALKGQEGGSKILEAFHNSNSTLYDLEGFAQNGNRLLTFGFYAGVVGAFLGVKAFGSNLGPLKPNSLTELSTSCQPITAKIGIVGVGRTSKGVQRILTSLGLPYTVLGRGDHVDPTQYDIFFNCICLSPDYKEKWVLDSVKPLLIVDISCDASKPNSPLPPIRTTWEEPVYRSGNLSVIAIDNLPSLIPRESSMDFSSCMADIIDFHGGPLWKAV
jgi:saccharopine dehydrogenase (NAD+, L-lysine-forming)